MTGFATAAFRAAILGTAALAISACAGPRDRGGDGYAGTPYYADDPCDHDRSYCDYPVYEGGVYIDGSWYDGRYRYRDTSGGREYWFNKSWRHADQTRDRQHDGDHDNDHGHDHGGDNDHGSDSH